MNGQVRIEEMYAFVAVDDDGTEGVIAFLGSNGQWMPMVGADLSRIEMLRPIAEETATQLGKPVLLLRFTTRVLVETLGTRPNTKEENIAFRKAWDARVEEGQR